jgi:hypothetical protein
MAALARHDQRCEGCEQDDEFAHSWDCARFTGGSTVFVCECVAWAAGGRSARERFEAHARARGRFAVAGGDQRKRVGAEQ